MHSQLQGLTADDHPQYLLLGGARNSNSGFAVSGAFGSAALIPASGPGTRLIWYPAEAAFRAGRVQGNEWDLASIGDYSVAMGFDAVAFGTGSVSMGLTTAATAQGAVAFGDNTTADGQGSVAFGVNSRADADGSVAFGTSSTASGSYSAVFGQNSIAAGEGAAAFGANSTAAGNGSAAFGTNATATGANSAAFGVNVTASGASAMAAGSNATASGVGSVAVGLSTSATEQAALAAGSSTLASAPGAVALGITNQAVGRGAIAMGESNVAVSWAMAIGQQALALGAHSAAIGQGTETGYPWSVAVGRYNVPGADQSGTQRLFMVGNGTDNAARSNALAVYEDGDVEIGGTLTELSDARLKEGIEPLQGVLDRVLRLQPVTYRFREGPNRSQDQQIGLLAQDVREEFPELVRSNGEGYLSLSYTQLSAVLLQALREQEQRHETELAAQAEAHAAELAAQAERVNVLERRLAELEHLLAQQAAAASESSAVARHAVAPEAP